MAVLEPVGYEFSFLFKGLQRIIDHFDRNNNLVGWDLQPV